MNNLEEIQNLCKYVEYLDVVGNLKKDVPLLTTTLSYEVGDAMVHGGVFPANHPGNRPRQRRVCSKIAT